MEELIKRLEAATGPDRELDIAIDRALFPESYARPSDPTPVDLPEDFGKDAMSMMMHPAPAYTASIDAALTLVPEGARWDVQRDRTAAFASIDGVTTGRCATPAIALCIAALRARAERAGG